MQHYKEKSLTATDLETGCLAWWDYTPRGGYGFVQRVAAVTAPVRRRRVISRVRITVLQKLLHGEMAWSCVQRTVLPSSLTRRAPGEWTPPAGWDEWLRKTEDKA